MRPGSGVSDLLRSPRVEAEASRLPTSLEPALDDHRFVGHPWWSSPAWCERVDALRRDATRGHRRPFQIMTCTAGGPHLGEVTRSFVEMIERARITHLNYGDRPLLRWLLVERARCGTIDTMVDTLESYGVEIIRRMAPQSAAHSIFDGRCALLEAAAELDLSDAPIVLLLDDDLAFDALYSGPADLEIGAPWPLLPALWIFHETYPEIDVALGGVSGAPPLPASSTLLTNLFDLDAALQGGSTYDAVQRWSEVDHYYDLSPVRTVRQPYPMLGPLPDPGTMLDALMIHGTLARPLVVTPTTLASPRHTPVVRGGNTVVFDPVWLTLPHPQARLGDLRLRRTDTVWAQVAESLYGCRLGQVPWPLRHVRNRRGWTEQMSLHWRERLMADLCGVGLYRGIERWRTKAPWRAVKELTWALADVLACISARREQVNRALCDARRHCTRLLDRRPELAAVSSEIDAGLAAISTLDFGPAAIGSLLDGLGASLEVQA